MASAYVGAPSSRSVAVGTVKANVGHVGHSSGAAALIKTALCLHGRYLPQLVLTAIATPILVGVMWWQDWLSGLIVLLTLPLIPIFMVLIGLATRAVQQRQWQTESIRR